MENPKESLIAKKIWIGRKLRTIREDKEYCIGMLSILSTRSQEYISRIENGEILPTASALKQIAMALCVPLSDFDIPKDITNE